ncbi:MAG: transposase [Exilibacterium sp.]
MPSGMRDLLHRLGYKYNKPKLVPGKPDREAQKIFVEQYERFMDKKPENKKLLFVDTVHPEHNTMAAYGWIKKGRNRKLETNGGRQRLNLHGAINIEALEMTVIESTTINADSTVELLEILNQKYPLYHRLHIIL